MTAEIESGTGALIFLVAGEPSGDVLGARLMAAVKRCRGEAVWFAGVGGPRMAAEGLESLYPMDDLSVMGFAEVVPHIPRILRRLAQTEAAARRLRPNLVVTIDSPGFNFRLAARLRNLGVPLVHYVAPTVWAWRPGRARATAKLFDRLLVLLPFEPPYFEKEGLDCRFVGHPVLESGADEGDGAAFRRRHGIDAGVPVVCLLPGSRKGEIKYLLPVFAEVARNLSALRPTVRFVVPAADAVAETVARWVADWPGAPVVVHGTAEKHDAFAAANAALAASGTVSLELAMAGLPTVIAYRVNAFTAWLARRLVRARYATLVNLVLDRRAVPEFLQERCRADRLTAAVERLLADDKVRNTQIAAAREALTHLGLGGTPPSERAAEAILDLTPD